MRIFGLIGKPLSHSFSKAFFARKFADEGIKNCRYDAYELNDISDLVALIQANPELEGLNVTIPYKEAVLPFLSEENEVVASIHACNCIKIKNGQLTGYNTDVIGFEKMIEPYLASHHNRALVLGTGGAAKAVQYVLQKRGILYTSVSRNKNENCLTYEEVDRDVLEAHPIVINTTPAGMYPAVEEMPPLQYEHLGPQHFMVDLIYNPEKTKFLQRGEEKGATICNGLPMLIIQAEESWRIWNG